jgi:hypothetical protein
MARVQVLLRDRLRVDATSRLKTVNTIIEKLRREKMRLAEMQDIAGLRIVEEMGIGAVNEMVERIVSLFGLVGAGHGKARGPGRPRDSLRWRPCRLGECDPPFFVPIREIRPN